MSAPKYLKNEFDNADFFEGCLPVEVMACRGPETLKFGPWKPVGLSDDPSIEAVIQLRRDDLYGKTFNIVGFQTQIKRDWQKKIINRIPGLEKAEILRYGMVHRNSYIQSPCFLKNTFESRKSEGLWFAGQVTGVEGYVESMASGLVASVAVWARVNGDDWPGFPSETLLGALGQFVEKGLGEVRFQPCNIQFGLLPPLKKRYPKRVRKQKYLERAERVFRDHLQDFLSGWRESLELSGGGFCRESSDIY